MAVFYIGNEDINYIEQNTIEDVIETRGDTHMIDIDIICMNEKEADPGKFGRGDFLFIRRKSVAQMYRKSLRNKGVKIYRVKEMLIDVTDGNEEIYSWTIR
jgi:hypothetical protein